MAVWGHLAGGGGGTIKSLTEKVYTPDLALPLALGVGSILQSRGRGERTRPRTNSPSPLLVLSCWTVLLSSL